MLLEATERSGLDYSLLLDGDSDDFWYLVECCVDILRRERERAACVIQKCLRVFLASHTYSPFAPTAVWVDVTVMVRCTAANLLLISRL